MPVLCHDTAQERNRIVQFSQEIDKCLIIQTKPGKVLDHLRVRHISDEFIVHTAQEVNNRVLLTARLDAADNLMSLLPLFHESGNQFHRVLKITAHGYGTVTRRLAHAMKRRIELPEIRHVKDSLNFLIFGANLL